MRLNDPYNRPTLYIRRPGSDAEEIHTFHDDDPFFSEVDVFLDAVDAKKGWSNGDGKPREILSTFEDGESSAIAASRCKWEADRALTVCSCKDV